MIKVASGILVKEAGMAKTMRMLNSANVATRRAGLGQLPNRALETLTREEPAKVLQRRLLGRGGLGNALFSGGTTRHPKGLRKFIPEDPTEAVELASSAVRQPGGPRSIMDLVQAAIGGQGRV